MCNYNENHIKLPSDETIVHNTTLSYLVVIADIPSYVSVYGGCDDDDKHTNKIWTVTLQYLQLPPQIETRYAIPNFAFVQENVATVTEHALVYKNISEKLHMNVNKQFVCSAFHNIRIVFI